MQPCNLYCLSLLLTFKQQRWPLSLISALCTPTLEIIIILIGRYLQTRNGINSPRCVPAALVGCCALQGRGRAMGRGGFALSAGMHLGGPCPISSRCPHACRVPRDSPAPTGAGIVAALDGGRCPPRRDPFILDYAFEVLPCTVKSSSKRELSEGRINLLNNKNPAHLLMKCNDFETGKMDRAVASSRLP